MGFLRPLLDLAHADGAAGDPAGLSAAQPDSVVWDVGGGDRGLGTRDRPVVAGGRVQALGGTQKRWSYWSATGPLWYPKSRGVCRSGARRSGQVAPAPDRVLLEVGRPLGDVLRAVWDAMAPAGRLVISTTSLEGLVDATDHLGQLAANDVQVSQTTVHRMVRRSNQTRLAAAEPLFVIAAERHP